MLGKEEPGKRHLDCGGRFVAVLNRAVRVGLIEKVTSEQRNKKREKDEGMHKRGTASAKTLSTE